MENKQDLKVYVNNLAKQELAKDNETLLEPENIPKVSFFSKEKPKPEMEDTNKIVKEIHKQAVLKVVSEDKDVQNEILEKAKNAVKSEFDSIEQEAIGKRQQKTYDANEEACKNYGIDKAVPLWQIRMMRVGSNVWFVIYFIIATFTITPINIFFKGIKSFIKQTWLAIIFSVFTYLLITVGIPLIIKLTQK